MVSSKTILAVIAAFAVGVFATPLPQEATRDHTIEELLAMDADLIQSGNSIRALAAATTVSDAQLNKLYYYAEFASAAYCDPDHTPGTEVTCKNNICPQVTANNVTTIIEFSNLATSDTTGVVARDDTNQAITVVFRGSQSIRNWFANLQILWTDASQYCSGCKIHTGFNTAFREQLSVILGAVKQLHSQYPSYKLVVVGHSLGGAIATLTATEFRRLGYTTELYSYGAPRVGNDKFSTFISNQPTNYRVTHLNDPIPRLPPVALGYYHVSPEHWISRGDTNIKAPDVHVLHGILNTNGNTGRGLISINVKAHLQYFTPQTIAACGGIWDWDLFD